MFAMFTGQLPVSSPQASPKVEASDRPKKAQHLPISRKVQNGNTRVHQGPSDSRGMDVVDRPVRRLTNFTSPSTQHQGSNYGFSTVLKCSSSPPSLLA